MLQEQLSNRKDSIINCLLYWSIFKSRLILINYWVYIVFIKLISLQKIVYFLPEISILNGLQANFCLNCAPSVSQVTFAPTVSQWCPKCV